MIKLISFGEADLLGEKQAEIIRAAFDLRTLIIFAGDEKGLTLSYAARGEKAHEDVLEARAMIIKALHLDELYPRAVK